ncbi:methyl-accepting chemotaxis protein [Pontibacillus halophilus JSM 076056 = DSM 19796]|uniref:Methyl-accepting chemotaxis protein n=1 Tax=Pontibacillus halophilus JSM 076056 = DSM 19796 TaxID=1385510 RepID=A0A0A5IC79_9BACI|nr:methyl-accepting chemotaxis protein [Pontibacillus halophilus]KGX93447.1 methyl-accepting chemotaxis protein [Pontibacillus halophilus JSM 076056 = DSM 19796]
MRKSIRAKLISISLLLLCVPSLVIGLIGYATAQDSLDELGRTTLKNGVEMAIQTIDTLQEDVSTGALDQESAQERMKELLIGPLKADGTRDIESPVDLGENGYFMVYNTEGQEIAHPSLENENVWDVTDKDGQLFVQNQIKTAQDGGGFTTYSWTFPNSENVGEKITYNQYDKEWGWVVAASTYEKDFNAPAQQLLYVLLITLGAALLIGSAIIYLFSKHLANPLRDLTTQVDEIAAGNLSIDAKEVTRQDEIGQLDEGIQLMVTNLKSLIGAVNESASSINATSQNLSAVAEETNASGEEISKAIGEISQGATQQAADFEDTFEITSNLIQQIQEVSDQNHRMLEISKVVEEANEQGMTSVVSLSEKSEETSTLISDVQEMVSNLSHHVKEIETVVGTIDEISAQTNLLALNASIEAARAGEHGKGFAVVAEEVRKLAEQTSRSTNEVNQTISTIVEQTNHANNAMERTYRVVGEQNNVVGLTKESFTHINESVAEITNSIEAISKDMKQLIQSKDTLYQSMESVTAVTEETAASTQQVSSSVAEQQNAVEVVASSANELSDATQSLQQELNQFKL